MRAPLFLLVVLLASSCRDRSTGGSEASLPRTDATSDVDAAPTVPPAPSSMATPVPIPDYRFDQIEKAIETSGVGLRQGLVSRFHEESARANGVSVARHRATVAVTSFKHVRTVSEVYYGFEWAFYSGWVRVEGRTSTSFSASMLTTRGGRTVIDASTAQLSADTFPVLSAHLRVHSLQDAKRRMRVFYAIDRMTPTCDRNFQMIMAEGTILDLRSGCSYLRWMETPPPPPDFAMFPCGPDGLPLKPDGGSDAGGGE